MRFTKMFVTIGSIACLFIAATTANADVTIETLLQEMVDRDAVARLPAPPYTCQQASSWDRSQTEVGGKDWFANRDFDRYLREETNQGRTEYVILEDDGPGCVTRIWRPLDIGDTTKILPQTIIRFYLDNNPQPAIESDFTELMSAQSLFKEPFSFIASDEKESVNQIGLPEGMKQMGGDLYFPIPYATSCRITLEVRQRERAEKYKGVPVAHTVFFYIINYRSYAPGTKVRTFSIAEYESTKALRQQVSDQLSAPGTNVRIRDSVNAKTRVDPGKAASIALPQGPHAIRELMVKLSPRVNANVVRDLFVKLTFDGEQTVWCPLSELFGGGYFDKDAHPKSPTADGVFIRPVWNRNRRVEANGRSTCWFVMPYQSQAKCEVVNTGSKVVDVALTAGVSPWDWDDRSMYFHANWRTDKDTTQLEDWNYIEIKGNGVYVADTLSVFSTAKGWYGEGDERIYIDGQAFPSHLGTGTEDYYGYAWGMAHFWNSSFLSAPPRDGRGKADWSGHQSVSRERLLDAIPFKSALKVDMEIWHAPGVQHTVGTMWYARPGAKHNRSM